MLAAGVKVEIEGRFVAPLDMPPDRPQSGAMSTSHGFNWILILQPKGEFGDAGEPPRVGIALLRGGPTRARYESGFINLKAAPPVHHRAVEVALDDGGQHLLSSTDTSAARSHDPDAGWVVRGRAAPCVRILEVSDPAP